MYLIDATPTNIQPMGNKGWCISFGETGVGRVIGVVYLLPDDPHYTRFRIVQGEKVPLYEPIGERPLTEEEIQHFEQLVRKQ